VLGRFTPQLCDAVFGREDSAAVLAELARTNMFLVALDAAGSGTATTVCSASFWSWSWSWSSGTRTRASPPPRGGLVPR
jgi:hypothetical protein